MIEYVGWPFETAFLQPLLQDRDGQPGARTVFRQEGAEVAQSCGVVLGRGLVTKVLGPQEPTDELYIDGGCTSHGDTPLGSSKPTARRSSVANFRYSPVAWDEVWPKTSPMILSGTPERMRLTARA